MYLTAAGDPVKPLRVLRSPEEWAIFKEMRAKAKTWPYPAWKEWAVRNIVYAYSSKVAKQLGLQTPGKQVPSPLFYARLRASKVDGTLQAPQGGGSAGPLLLSNLCTDELPCRGGQ